MPGKPVFRLFALALCVALAACLFCGCGAVYETVSGQVPDPEAPAPDPFSAPSALSAQARPAEPLKSVTLELGGAGDIPTFITHKAITLYPGGLATLTDYTYLEENNVGDTVLATYEFRIPPEVFAEIEMAVWENEFAFLPDDFGLLATDSSYDSITIETETGSKTSGGIGLPGGDHTEEERRWNAVYGVMMDALGMAYFEDTQQTLDSVTQLSWLDSDFLAAIKAGETYDYEPEMLNWLIENTAVTQTIVYSDGRVEVISYQPPQNMSIDFPLAQLTETGRYGFRVDPSAFAELKKAVSASGFTSLPEYVPPTHNGEPIDELVGGTYTYFIANLDGQAHTSGTILTEETPAAFQAVYDAFSAARESGHISSSAPATAVEAIENWDGSYSSSGLVE